MASMPLIVFSPVSDVLSLNSFSSIITARLLVKSFPSDDAAIVLGTRLPR